MRLTTIILLAGCLQVAAKGTAQKVSLNQVKAPMAKVFDAIKQQSGYLFFYSESDLKAARPVTINANGLTIEQALELCFKNQPLTYVIVPNTNTVVVKEKSAEADYNFSVVMSTDHATKEIHGKVVTQDGQPAPGITVTIKGTKQITVTDDKGEFDVKNVDENTILVFTAVNVESLETTIGDRTTITLTLQVKRSLLDDVQIIGYGTSSKRLNTGAVGTVSAAEIDNQPVTNPLSAIQGRVTGVEMTSKGGNFGAAIDIKIRGLNTNFAAKSTPLFIVDGVAFPNTLDFLGNANPTTYFTPNPMNSINPDDIQSISILKDADATAVYGSRGANGVVLITTKKGAAGAMKVDVDIANGFSKAGHLMKGLLTTSEYLAMRKQAFQNANVTPTVANAPDLLLWSPDVDQDWQGMPIGNTGKYTNAQVSVSGGDERTRYLVSAAYNYQTGIQWSKNYEKRANIHANIENNSRDKRFKMSTSFTFSNDNVYVTGTGNTLTPFAIPNMPLYNPDGSIYYIAGNSNFTNPLYLQQAWKTNKTNNLILNNVLSYQVLPNLKASMSTGYNQLDNNYFSANPTTSVNQTFVPSVKNFSSFQTTGVSTIVAEPQLDYSAKIGNHKIQALLGGTWQQTQTGITYILGQNYSSDALIHNLAAAATISSPQSGTKQYNYESVFLRANYNWLDKYIVNGSFRRDGSSRFAENYKFGNFWSVGGAWIFSNEAFLKNNRILSYGKLRGSYGLTGNDQIGDYQYLDFYSASGIYNGTSGLYASQVSTNYRWEQTYKGDVGIELGFLKSRFLLTVDYYQNKSQNLITVIPFASQAGYAGYTGNLPAVVQNKGWEFSINTNNIKTKNFSWASSFNITLPKNILLAFPGLATSQYAGGYIIGKSLQSIIRYKFAGINPANGLPRFYDISGKVVESTALNSQTDKQYIGEENPRSFGGLGNIFTYKSFELNIFFQFSNSSTSTSPISAGSTGMMANTVRSMLDGVWTTPGQDASKPLITTNTFGPTFNYFGSDVGFVDNSYIRLKTLAFTWNMPAAWSSRAKLHNVKIYAQAENLLTHTKYIGIDPESGMTLPVLKTVTFGIKATL